VAKEVEEKDEKEEDKTEVTKEEVKDGKEEEVKEAVVKDAKEEEVKEAVVKELSLEEEFEKYVEIMKKSIPLIQKHPKEVRLAVYAHGRQGKFGDNKDPKPGAFDLIEKAKYNAYLGLKGMD
jgi:acyl-CoA-binding protein